MLCSINDPNCDKVAITRGWCGTHYQRWRIHGDPLYGGPVRRVRPQGMTEAEAFAWYMPGDPPPALPHVEGVIPPIEECWDWSASTRDGGYGEFQSRGISVNHIRAHVASHRIYNLNDPLTEDKPHAYCIGVTVRYVVSLPIFMLGLKPTMPGKGWSGNDLLSANSIGTPNLPRLTCFGSGSRRE